MYMTDNKIIFYKTKVLLYFNWAKLKGALYVTNCPDLVMFNLE